MHVLLIIIAIALMAGLVFLPSLWVRQVLQKYREPSDLFPGTGGELARHLLAKLNIKDVSVEESAPDQDHYDPVAKAVRLSPDNYNGRSLTAITIAAHEVGHAIQHAAGYPLFRMRHGLLGMARMAEKAGSLAIMAMPVLALVSRSPTVGGLVLLLGLGGIALGTVVHLVTLPLEWNASFGRALPMLISGNYISGSHARHAHKILKAAALTYVAGSLASLLSLYRWIAILRR